MYTDVKRLNLIEQLLKEKNELVLKSVEDIFLKSTKKAPGFSHFSNKLSLEEIAAFEKNIELGCEQINESDWK